MVCVLILYISGGTYSLKSTPNDRFEKLFIAIFIYSQSFCPKSAERKSPKKYFSYFVFDVWSSACTLVFRLISQHTTYYTTATSWFLSPPKSIDRAKFLKTTFNTYWRMTLILSMLDGNPVILEPATLDHLLNWIC